MTAPLQIFQEHRVLVDTVKPSAENAWTSTPIYETRRYRVDLDLDLLLRKYAARARKSKGKRATALGGAIKVTLCPDDQR